MKTRRDKKEDNDDYGAVGELVLEAGPKRRLKLAQQERFCVTLTLNFWWTSFVVGSIEKQ